MSELRTEDLQVGYGELVVLDGVTLQVPSGKITALVGRNGCGKSTLLKTMARILKPSRGKVYLDGEEVLAMSTREVARKLAILPQSPSAPSSMTVRGLVELGRYPHQNLLGQKTAEDVRAVGWALEVTGLEELALRHLSELSGGQRQRAWIAMALAQGTELLLLDEPTTYLDMAHQLEVLELLRRLNTQEGKTVVMVVHDLNHATRYADHMVAVLDGRVVSEGPPGELLTPDFFVEVFGVRARVLADEDGGRPLCLPLELVR